MPRIGRGWMPRRNPYQPKVSGPTTYNQSLPVTVTFTPLVTKQVRRTFALTATFTAAMKRSVGKLLRVGPYLYFNNEGGINGNDITADIGDTSSGNWWDDVPLGAPSASVTYDNAHSHSGTLASKVVSGTTGQPISLVWDQQMDDTAEAFARAYVYLAAVPSGSIEPIQFSDGTAVPGAVVLTDSASVTKLRVRYASTTSSLSSTTIPLNQWVRLELRVKENAGAGAVECRIFTDPEATTPTETVSLTGISNGSSPIALVAFGIPDALSGSSTQNTLWMDDFGVARGDWVGPAFWYARLTAGKITGKLLALTATFTAAMTRTVGKLLPQTVTYTPVLKRTIGKPLAVTVTFTAALLKSAGKTLAQTVTFTPALRKTVGKPLSQTVTFTALLIRSVGKLLSQSVTYVGALGRLPGKLLAVTVTFAVALIRRTGKLLAQTATFTAAMVRSVGKLLAQPVTFTAALTKRVGKVLSQTATFTAAMSTIKAINKVLSQTVTFTAAMVRSPGKLLAQAVTYTTALIRRTSKTLAQTVTFSPVVSKRVSKTLALGATFAASVVRSVGKALALPVTFTADVLRSTGTNEKALNVVVTFAPVVAKTVGKRLSATVNWFIDLVRFKFRPKPDVIGEIVLKAQARGYRATNSDFYIDMYEDTYTGDTGMVRGEITLAAHYQRDETGDGGYVDDYEDVY